MCFHVLLPDNRNKVYVLPDGYPVFDPSLEDIAFVLHPTFAAEAVSTLSSPSHLNKISFDLANKPYLPGYVGLNNIKHNDHMNVIILALTHVPSLRDHALLSSSDRKDTELAKRFAALTKKIWNPRLFKCQVSPHEFLQEVARISAGKFRLEQQGDPTEFLGWLLNHLHRDMGGTKKRNSSGFPFVFLEHLADQSSDIGIIFSTFQGELRTETQQIVVKQEDSDKYRPLFDIDRGKWTSFVDYCLLRALHRDQIRYYAFPFSVVGFASATALSGYD